MTTTLIVLQPRPGVDVEDLCARFRALADVEPEITFSRAEVVAPGAVLPDHFGAGSIIWESNARRAEAVFRRAEPRAAARQVMLDASVRDVVPLAPLAEVHVPSTAPLVKRTLLLRVRPGTPSVVVERFEADLAAMPAHISTIRSWRLSRVLHNSRWTHAWEQEFASLDGLTGEYMTNPYHWTTVDRWFDAEVPEHIVEPELAHLFADRDEPWSREELPLSPTS